MRKRIEYKEKVLPVLYMGKGTKKSYNKIYVKEHKNYWGIKTVKTSTIVLSNNALNKKEIIEHNSITKKYFN